MVDKATVESLRQTGRFSNMPPQRDVDEHSLEMHLPYLYQRLEQTFGNDSSKFPSIVPILVGDGSVEQEKSFGQLLAPHLKDPENVFIVSSDFCHWGPRFSYRPQYSDGAVRNLDDRGPGRTIEVKAGLLDRLEGPDGPPIHEVIRVLDKMAMDAIETGIHSDFYETVQETQNTICGRHPIGVVVAALEVLRKDEPNGERGKFRFTQYQRSSLVQKTRDSSVSYASAYAIV